MVGEGLDVIVGGALHVGAALAGGLGVVRAGHFEAGFVATGDWEGGLSQNEHGKL